MSGFHEVVFPFAIALGASGGPERRTQIITLASGREERNSPWMYSRRRWDAGAGVKTLDDLALLTAFFEARRGALYGFRWRDPLDDKSCAPSAAPAPSDQPLGVGDGQTQVFQLTKRYESGGAFVDRPIVKPVAASVLVAVDGVALNAGGDYTVDANTGLVSFTATPASGAALTAGFAFHTPVRFDTDRLDISVEAFGAGQAARVPVVELRL